jgi:hypothetical protein
MAHSQDKMQVCCWQPFGTPLLDVQESYSTDTLCTFSEYLLAACCDMPPIIALVLCVLL